MPKVDFTEPAEIHVWHVSLGTPLASSDSLRASLTKEERNRADRFHFEAHRTRWVNARFALRHILASYLGALPHQVSFSWGRQGKPYLNRHVHEESLHFNLAHSAELALVGVTRLVPLGVDVEHLREIPDASEIAQRFFSKQEYQELMRVAPSLRHEAFYNGWTRKEAFIKALGLGLSFPLDAFSVTLFPQRPARIRWIEAVRGDARQWRLFAFAPQDEYVAAIALRTSDNFSLQHLRFVPT